MEDLINVSKERVEGAREIEPDCSQWFLLKGQEAMGTTEIQEMPFNHWKRTLFGEEGQIIGLEQVVQRGCGVVFLEVFKTQLDVVLSNLLQLVLLEHGGIELDDLQRLLLTSTSLPFCNSTDR